MNFDDPETSSLRWSKLKVPRDETHEASYGRDIDIWLKIEGDKRSVLGLPVHDVMLRLLLVIILSEEKKAGSLKSID
jgi:hypothetical protein